MSTSPFFIVGCPRSGTTLLQRILNAHPEVAIAPETHYVRRFWLKDRSRERGLEETLSGLTDMPEFAEMGLDGEEFRRRIAAASPTHHGELFGELLEDFRERTGAWVVGEKTPNHALYISTLAEWFPEAKFLHIVRDPRAVANSWRAVPWSTGSLATDAAVWRKYLSRVRGSIRAGFPILSIRYEDLLADPTAVLLEVSRFLRVPLVESMLRYHQREEDVINVRREPWKSLTSEPFRPGRRDAWRTELSGVDVRLIESVVWPEMARWGYRPETAVGELIIRKAVRDLMEVRRDPLRVLKKVAASRRRSKRSTINRRAVRPFRSHE